MGFNHCNNIKIAADNSKFKNYEYRVGTTRLGSDFREEIRVEIVLFSKFAPKRVETVIVKIKQES